MAEEGEDFFITQSTFINEISESIARDADKDDVDDFAFRFGEPLCEREIEEKRLYRGEVDEQMICKVTGHRSDAVRTYKRTSDEQRRTLSDIIAKKRKQEVISEPTPIVTETSKPETSPEKDEMDTGRRFVLNFTFH
ncbi:uncharacterized protein LOC125377460 [Haliotis rufescens]|uniref:uncharacterized protein LOC125377460 n=1 Tax=Haliotis rufescens TaxID=6454 RepID=UPI00201F9817|nr:uncharacterized protein LOC125377460 [Haliotis rufescens]